ncbi:L2 [Gammapapillomavirus 22]|uniref:Minor capsid protein L2 n=1 Tax=Gammapapillomavirus 22 TaxID=1961679 RepID=A0A2D2AM12_9PAPI|nr:L2 [Gammapapillomavirus 22]
MNTAKRQKRDTAENLYRQCQITGNCPTDVVNKIENKTWADVLLQAFSSILFLGNLGIGTGKGSATLGVRPIPGGGTIPETIAPPTTSRPVIPKTTVSRPTRPFSVPIDTLSIGARPVDPAGVKPIDVIDPTSPAIVTLTEAIPDTVITLGEGTVPDLEVVTDTSSINSHPTVFQSAENGVAILNVTPAEPPPTKVLFVTETLNPSFESTVGHIDTSYNVFVNPFATDETITFGEQIPLEPILPRSEFEIEDIPKTSTPLDTVARYYNRGREFYRRYVQQVPTRNINLLGDVSKAVQFGFDNPAFDPEITLQFQQDVNEVAAAPDSDFANIQKISRPFLTATADRTVRVSRFGSRAGVRTRSGVTVGQDVHFFYDISPIEHLELSTFSNSNFSVVEPSTQDTYIQPSTVDAVLFQDSDLIDPYSETFNNVHLQLQTVEEPEEVLPIPISNPFAVRPVVLDINTGQYVSATNTSSGHPAFPSSNIIPFTPDVFVDTGSQDYIIHPSLIYRRKRKRSDSF